MERENSPGVPTKYNFSKSLASELVGTLPIIYGFRQSRSIAYRMKTQFNENNKVPSKYDVFPELTHNETLGFEAPAILTKNYNILLIRDHEWSTEI